MIDFDKHWNEWAIASNCTEDEAKIHFEAGQQSQQAKIDVLKKQLSRLGYTDNGAELMKPPLGKTPDFGLVSMQRDKIDELQGRIDRALRELELLTCYRTGNSDNAIDILKGNKDD